MSLAHKTLYGRIIVVIDDGKVLVKLLRIVYGYGLREDACICSGEV